VLDGVLMGSLRPRAKEVFLSGDGTFSVPRRNRVETEDRHSARLRIVKRLPNSDAKYSEKDNLRAENTRRDGAIGLAGGCCCRGHGRAQGAVGGIDEVWCRVETRKRGLRL